VQTTIVREGSCSCFGLKSVATAQQQGLVFIAGDRPVTEDQVQSKLQAERWSNAQIEREGKYFGVSAMRNGQSGRLAIDSEPGRLRANDDDDDD
jgi:phenylpropionate dioxygenase-like ring-hydroxylating dioxygenase large terminal subunit